MAYCWFFSFRRVFSRMLKSDFLSETVNGPLPLMKGPWFSDPMGLWLCEMVNKKCQTGRPSRVNFRNLKLSKTNMVHLKMNPGSLEIPNSYSKPIIFSFHVSFFGSKPPFTAFRSQKRNHFWWSDLIRLRRLLGSVLHVAARPPPGRTHSQRESPVRSCLTIRKIGNFTKDYLLSRGILIIQNGELLSWECLTSRVSTKSDVLVIFFVGWTIPDRSSN